jgi:multimeric flavodoxin WrbA
LRPENLAAISGLMKDFFDRSYYGVLDRIQGRPYASLVCAGSDGHNAAGRWNALPPAGV